MKLVLKLQWKNEPKGSKSHIIISYPDAGLGHCPEGQGPDIKHKF